MSDLLKKIKTNSLATAILYAVLGVVLLVWPGVTAKLFCTVLGLVLVVCGIVDIITFLTHRDGTLYAGSRLVLGVILAVLGIYIMSQPSLVSVVIPRIIGILICVHGVGDIGDAITLQRNGYARWGAALALGIITLALGALLVYDPFDAFNTVVRIIGAFLLYDGISDVWIVSRVSSTLKQAAKDAKAAANAVDVDFTEEPNDKN